MAEDNADWTWWSDALRGINRLEGIREGEARCGYFRQKYHSKKSGGLIDRPVAIWKEGDQFVAKRGTSETAIDIRDQHQIGELYSSVCRTPVSYEAYLSAFNGKGWPGDLPKEALPERGFGDNSLAADPYELAVEEARVLRAAYEKLEAEIGDSEPTETQSQQMAEYAARWQELFKKFDDARADEKEPHLVAGRNVDNKWRAIIAGCDGFKKRAKNIVQRFLLAERDRREKAAAEERRIAEEKRQAEIQRQREEAEERRRQAELDRQNPFLQGAPEPEPEPEVIPVLAAAPTIEAEKPKLRTSGRSIALRKVKCVRIVDLEQAKAAFIKSPAGEQATREWVEKFGPDAPFAIPGTEQFIEERAT